MEVVAMNQSVMLLRVAYWAGIIMDAVAAVQMLFPNLMVAMYGVTIQPDAEFIFAMRYGAPLMIGWTALLFWADRRPVERKDILLLTVPVVLGYICMVLYAISLGYVTFGKVAPALVMQAVLMGLFIGGYVKGRRLSSGE
jgi:hypothetical protein